MADFPISDSQGVPGVLWIHLEHHVNHLRGCQRVPKPIDPLTLGQVDRPTQLICI